MRFQDLPVPIQSFRLKPTGDIPYQKDGKPLPVKSIKASEAVFGSFDVFANGAG